MKACLSEINKLRATADGNWPELFEELYANYSSSNLFRVMNFIEYCKFAAKANDKYLVALEEVQRIHSVVWYISMMTDDYIGLDEKLQELEKQRSSILPCIHSDFFSSSTPKDKYQAVTSS